MDASVIFAKVPQFCKPEERSGAYKSQNRWSQADSPSVTSCSSYRHLGLVAQLPAEQPTRAIGLIVALTERLPALEETPSAPLADGWNR